MTKLIYSLELLEPVLVTAPGGDPNTDESLPYLPGSQLRGALVQKYLYQYGKDGDFTAVFLDGTVRYLNGYPARGERSTLPTPAHWKLAKDPAAGSDAEKRRVYSSLQDDAPPATKSIGASFISVEDGYVHPSSPTFAVAVHNARNRKKGRAIPDDETNRSALFRYHALAPQQKFIASIVGPEALVSKIEKLIEGKITLGGSSTAGYGLTKIQQISLESNTSSGNSESAIPAHTPFIVYLTSNAVLRHPRTGQPTTKIPDVLQNHFPGELTLVKAFSRTGWVGGFNQKWGLPLPQVWGFLMGTVWQLICNVDISTKQIQTLEAEGIGERRAEGFGQLCLNPAWPDLLKMPHLLQEDEEVYTPEFVDLDVSEAAILEAMNARIAQQQLDRHLATAVQAINVKGIRLSNSQLARLRLKVRQQTNNLSTFQEYLAGTVERKSADDQFRKSRIKGVGIGSQNFREWLELLIQSPQKVWAILSLEPEGWQLLGADSYQLDETLARTYTIRLIDAVCERAQKEGRGS